MSLPGTRPNQLFLTEANERNVDLLKPLSSWFRDHLTVVRPDAAYQPLVLRAQTDVQFKEFLSQFLGIADTGIQGIDLDAEELDFSRHFPAMSEPERKSLLDELGRDPDHYLFFRAGKTVWGLRQEPGQAAQVLRLRTRHQTSDGRQVLFEARDESDGTHRMMHLAPALLDLQCAENVYVIDELDRSLHPHLCRLYVDAFLRGVSVKKNCGQIILTTHETNLLDLDLLRRDEIWFVEKDKEGASHLTSLAEFKYKVRADLKIARGYLNGRFGAIPFIGDARKLLVERASMQLTSRRPRPLDRRIPHLRDTRLVIIATEGECTEKQYFSIFERKSTRVQVRVLETTQGMSAPKHVLDRLRRYRREYELWPRGCLVSGGRQGPLA